MTRAEPHRRRRGAVAAWAAVSMTALAGMTALAVDGGYLYNVKADLQNAADAAALAAAITMFDDNGLTADQARISAARVAARNLNVPPETAYKMMDFTIGRYDNILDHSQKFIPIADSASNAVRVVLHRTEARGAPVQLFFSAAFGRRQADVSAVAVAGRAKVAVSQPIPLALRDPNFGPIDPDIVEHNPGKDGPSFPKNGEFFEVGEEVTVYAFGMGPRPMVHLTLDIPEWNGVSNTNAWLSDDMTKLDGQEVPKLSTGDQFLVENLGSGNENFGQKLLDRIEDDNPNNNLVSMPIVRTLPDTRDADGQIVGKVEIADFVWVDLDRVQKVVIPNDYTVQNTTDTITIATIVGTVVPKLVHTRLSSSGGKGTSMFTPILLR